MARRSSPRFFLHANLLVSFHFTTLGHDYPTKVEAELGDHWKCKAWTYGIAQTG